MENKEIQIKENEIVETSLNTSKAIKINDYNAAIMENRLNIINQCSNIIKKHLIDGEDYGVIPGTKKPTLFKPGAIKIKMLYGLIDKYKIIHQFKGMKTFGKNEEYMEEYTFECELYQNDKLIGTGMGHITDTEKGKTGTPTNTLLKLGKKRALIDAITGIGGLSSVFTQDLDEDNPLSTKQAKLNLGKFEKISTYTKIYQILDYDKTLPKKEQEKFKADAKEFIAKLSKLIDIPNIMEANFNKNHQKVLLEIIEKNKEKFKKGKK